LVEDKPQGERRIAGVNKERWQTLASMAMTMSPMPLLVFFTNKQDHNRHALSHKQINDFDYGKTSY